MYHEAMCILAWNIFTCNSPKSELTEASANLHLFLISFSWYNKRMRYLDTFLKSMKKYRVLWIFAILVFCVMVLFPAGARRGNYLKYVQSLDKVLYSVEGEKYTLRDFAVYVAYQEATVEKEALAYNPDNPKDYWNTRVNGMFVSTRAKQNAIQMAVHDALFYQLSEEMKLEFTEEESEAIRNNAMDFWYDMTDREAEVLLGITEEEVYDSLYRIAMAEKCQYICEKQNGLKEGSYNIGTEEFEAFLSKYEYKIEKSVLNSIDFGNVTYLR